MKVKWLGETEFLTLTNGKVYDVMSIKKGWYRVIDDSGEDYLYPARLFEIVEGGEPEGKDEEPSFEVKPHS